MPLRLVLSELKAIILTEISHIQGFMQLLMKPRNGMPWSQEDRAAILLHLKHLAKSLPVLLIFTLPGGSLLLPILAWFLDRRKTRNQPSAIPVPETIPTETPAVSTSVGMHSSETTRES
jgi:hypothetical protein